MKSAANTNRKFVQNKTTEQVFNLYLLALIFFSYGSIYGMYNVFLFSMLHVPIFRTLLHSRTFIKGQINICLNFLFFFKNNRKFIRKFVIVILKLSCFRILGYCWTRKICEHASFLLPPGSCLHPCI